MRTSETGVLWCSFQSQNGNSGLVVLAFLFAIFLGVPWLAYRHGKRVGDQVGYIRGYKEGQQTGKG
jgi:hypothetical protein